MKRKKERSRATHVAGDSRKRRLHQLFKVCAVLLLPTLYLFYSLSGLYLVDVEISKLKEQIIWCLLHPLKVYNDKSYSMVLVGGLLWMICSFQAYSKSDHNRMPGNEFGSAKWGEVRAFNEKYAARTEETKSGLSPENKVLSQNVRFRYDSDTLRNNNIVVVGGSGAGKTAFFLTPNLMSLHDCNIYTDPKGKLPMDVGLWLDEMANIKMPNNFDKILATCRSRGVYCVPILQSLAQLKTLFADGAWEGIVGNCDTFIYLGGNEASTYEYVSKLLGKWTIDKRTSGESKGTSGSYSENYDVLGRELMLEYELRLLPDDECIIFVRGENPIRDKKWFPWEHEAYLEARKCGAFVPAVQKEKQKQQMEECDFIGEESLEYLKKQQSKNENIRLYELDAFSFMMMDLDAMEKKIHSTPKDVKGAEVEKTITAGMIQSAVNHEMKREAEERKVWFVENFDKLTLLDIYASEWMSETRRKVIRELLQAGAEEEVIKSIIRPEIEEGQVLQKKGMWLEMQQCSCP